MRVDPPLSKMEGEVDDKKIVGESFDVDVKGES
jgi:hypothetical protein